jgi:hypothetical protein
MTPLGKVIVGASVLVVGIVLSFIALIIYSSVAEERRRRQQIHTIKAAGGPRTFEEYRVLVPESCRKCGSRKMRRTSWEASWQGDIGASGTFTDSGSYTSCARCGTLVSGHSGSGETYRESVGDEFTVESPYLSSEENMKLPDWTA